ncbi:MAG TPA: hypothetical protein VF458_15195 [Ktedonobacteraceae bacterium]
MTSDIIESPTDNRTDRQGILIGMSLEEYRYMTRPMEGVNVRWTSRGELVENSFATEPMLSAPRPSRMPRREQEEEWHTSFEQAISERAARVSLRLRRLSTTSLNLQSALPATDPLPLPAAQRSFLTRVSHAWRAHKRAIVMFCLGLALFLAGFDLLGLLVLLR